MSLNLVGILTAIKGVFSNGGPGNTAGNVIAHGASWFAFIAAIAPAAFWFVTHKDDVAVEFTLTYAQLAVVAALVFGPLVIVLKVIHYTRPGRPEDRGQG